MSERLAMYLTVRVECDARELAEHLTTDPEQRRLLSTDLDRAAEALEIHLTPLLEDPVWDSPAELSVVAVLREERGATELTVYLPEEEEGSE